MRRPRTLSLFDALCRFGTCCLPAAALLAALTLAGCSHPNPPAAVDDETLANWNSYGGNGLSDRYSPLTQITRDNVQYLQPAWVHRSGDVADGRGEWTRTVLQVTPIVDNDTLYYCTPFGRVFALDPQSGAERWAFDPQVQNKRGGYYPAACRGVSYWQAQHPESVCDKRIFYGTRDAELIALDADSGQPCADFGRDGRVDLRAGLGQGEAWEYYPTSPPLVMNDTVIIGALVPDNLRTDVPGGVIRAFDARSGALRWAWDPVPEDYRQRHQLSGDELTYRRGTPNAWAPMSGDSERGLVFVPTGNPSPDLYGGERDGSDAYGSSVVALDIHTGTVAWHFQTVHHDVWDYDVAAQPSLFQIDGVGSGRAGLLVAAKTGHVFLLDRATGEPLYPVEERPVPQDGVPGETLSPTQPYPTHPAPLHFPATLNADNVGGIIGLDSDSCRRELAKYRNEGLFTPPSLQGSVLYPSTTGGINWGGVSIDPARGLMFVNQMHLASVVQLLPRADYDALAPTTHYPQEYFAMTGTPYGAARFPLMSSLGTPCNPRPWSSFTAVDLRSGKIQWQIPLGTLRDIAPIPLPFNWGGPTIGGSVATAAGLVFIGATADNYFRAYDSGSGKELWRYRLPTTANANPISFRLDKQHKQYVVVAVGGHGWSKPDDRIMAFALPDSALPP